MKILLIFKEVKTEIDVQYIIADLEAAALFVANYYVNFEDELMHVHVKYIGTLTTMETNLVHHECYKKLIFRKELQS
jgi:hypothetical protein